MENQGSGGKVEEEKIALKPSHEINLDSLFQKWGNIYRLDWKLIKAVATVESELSPSAIGDDGVSFGLMQIKIATAKGYGMTDAENLLDPDTNVKYGAKFLAEMIVKYGLDNGVQIYALGEPKFLKKGKRAPDYLNRVISAYDSL